ncbi:S-layer homology domain-containing protein [Acetivibrio cellulolyticus]|uniref:S-layer homology domain-containing protein n=1 Tax=Acetivibrio cellulolyticus TaxID=35830 RepID=UPI0001E2D0C7|nr:S-layer homology domain-containing protein [Acetivibrio cellulolyticus]
MNYKVKLAVSVLSAVIALNVSSVAFAAFSDVSPKASYADEVNHLASLGIINGNENGEFKPNDMITREQFARLIIAAADEDYKADIYKKTTVFPDISSSRWSSGFVNAAVKLGYMKGMLDGKFHPTEGVTYSQVCTVLVKMLGYTDSDLSGTWPQSYLVKAKEIGLSDGVNFTSNDQMPRWAVAVMLDNLLDSSLKSNPAKKFSETIDSYAQYIVLATSETSSSVSEGEVLTDKGTFIIGDASIKLELGNKYRLNVDDNTIYGVYSNMSDSLNLSIDSISSTTITYKDATGTHSMILPSAPTYYYKGVQQKYDAIPGLLEKCSSIVFNKNASGTGYEYAVISDPIYSKPEVVGKSNKTNEGVGKIKFESRIEITKSGTIITVPEIEQDDVIYEVTDIWGGNKYILDVENSVDGELTDILPNKVSPKKISVDGVSYELGEYMDLSKINSQGVMKVKDSVTVLLGYDGKVVDMYSSDEEDNSDYAIVLNNYKEKSTSVENYGTEYTYVKLLHTDNTTKTYRLADDGDDNNDLTYTAKLVKYKEVNKETADEFPVVELQKLDYLNSKEYEIDTNKKTIDSHYFADNIKIFNIVNEVYGTDCNIYLMDPSKLPDGIVFPGKIKYLNMVGPFEDINVMLVDNILDEDEYLGVVTKKESSYSRSSEVVYTNTILIGDKEYTTNYNSDDVYEGCVVEVEMRDGKIMGINSTRQPLLKTFTFDAVDSTRVKIGGKIYNLKSNASIYFLDYDGNYEKKGTDEIDVTHKYDKISVYFDDSLKYGGEVEIIVIED